MSCTFIWEISLREFSNFMYKISINIIFYSISYAYSRNMPAFNIKMFKLLIKFTKDEVDTSGRFYFFCVFYFDEYL